MAVLLAAFTASGNNHPYLFSAIFFFLGVFLFAYGFQTYRKYRLLEDTPEIPVRSVAMGLVHVRGKTTGDDRLASPLTGVPCYYYRVELEKWTQSGKDERWETVRTDTEEREFYLDDGIAKIRINPRNAEYDLPQTFRAELGPKSGHAHYIDPSLGVAGPSEQDLRAYLTADFSRARAALATMDMPGAKTMGKVLAVGEKLESLGVSFSGGGLNMDLGNSGQSYRFTEHCLLAERECNIIGTCAENPSPKDDHDRNLIMKGQNEKTFLITSKSENQIEKSLRWKAFGFILGGAAMAAGAVALALHVAGLI
ncbi:MAG TPA: hypothetical protein VMX16_11750 [Terriglobia bacterium]|nr:hypothetical protein [Terriglobia bacterium]